MTNAVNLTLTSLWKVQVTWEFGHVTSYLTSSRQEATAVRAVFVAHPAITKVECHPYTNEDADTHRADAVQNVDNARTRPETRDTGWWRLPAALRRRARPAPTDNDEMLAAIIRAATDELFRGVDELRTHVGWPRVEYETRAHRAVEQTRIALRASHTMALPDLVAAIKPVLDEWWPGHPSVTSSVKDIIDCLRAAAAAATYSSAHAPADGFEGNPANPLASRTPTPYQPAA